jgi:hypothetical protein
MSLKMFVVSDHYEVLMEYLQKRLDASDCKLRKLRGDDLLQEQGKAQELAYLLQLKDKVNKDQV